MQNRSGSSDAARGRPHRRILLIAIVEKQGIVHEDPAVTNGYQYLLTIFKAYGWTPHGRRGLGQIAERFQFDSECGPYRGV